MEMALRAKFSSVTCIAYSLWPCYIATKERNARRSWGMFLDKRPLEARQRFKNLYYCINVNLCKISTLLPILPSLLFLVVKNTYRSFKLLVAEGIFSCIKNSLHTYIHTYIHTCTIFTIAHQITFNAVFPLEIWLYFSSNAQERSNYKLLNLSISGLHWMLINNHQCTLYRLQL